MDNQNTQMDLNRNFEEWKVLILVLMDNQNTGSCIRTSSKGTVLILVLMDNQNTTELLGAVQPFKLS